MTSISIPVPKTPLATIQTDQAGRSSVVMSREWYRYLSLLGEASGGSTDTNIDVLILSGASDVPAEQEGAQSPQILAPTDLTQIIEAVARQLSFPVVPSEPSPVTPDVPFPMPPVELGALEAAVTALQAQVANLQAAENLAYRIVAAGAAVLVGGTVTVASAQANSANQFALTTKTVGGTQGMLSVGTVIANTSFVINSSAPLDTSTVSWVIYKAI